MEILVLEMYSLSNNKLLLNFQYPLPRGEEL